MDKHVSENDGYKYMLNVIDTFSKYAWAESNTEEQKQCCQGILIYHQTSSFIWTQAPNVPHMDKGGEFEDKEFKPVLAEHHQDTPHGNEEKSTIIELFNRTLTNKMKVQFEVRKNFRWVNILQGSLRAYNSV